MLIEYLYHGSSAAPATCDACNNDSRINVINVTISMALADFVLQIKTRETWRSALQHSAQDRSAIVLWRVRRPPCGWSMPHHQLGARWRPQVRLDRQAVRATH